ncbi:MAG: RNA polymerase-binding protein DksA [Pseudomonadota bacterium]
MPVRKKAKKTTSKKKTVSKKKVAKKAVSKKKTAKKVAKKATAKKKTTTKATAKKTTKKKVTKKVAAKKTTKKAPSKKKVAKKAPAKKAVAKKKTSISKKKVAKKAPVKKTPMRKPAARKTAAKPRRDLTTGPIHGIAPYQPKRSEEYMSDAQLEHFRKILTAWKRELMQEVDRTVHHMQDEAANFPDPNDRATQESEFGLELRTRDRERKLLRKISQALTRIDDGSYGYCEETGEEIGLKRLEARPVATLCLEAQERRELSERQFRDRDDRYR